MYVRVKFGRRSTPDKAVSKLQTVLALLAETLTISSAWEGARRTVSKQDITLLFTKHLKPKDFVSSSLPNYCASGVLRSPTMWLGIFVGG